MIKGVAMANKKLVDLLLQDENANVANEEFETLIGADWVRLLSKKPQFADKCDYNEIIDDNGAKTTVSYWHKLTGVNWTVLLKKQPQFIEKCDWNKLHLVEWYRFLHKLLKKRENVDKIEINKLPANIAVVFLIQYPDLVEKYNKWSDMDEYVWCVLLQFQPQFADKCDKWDIFETWLWQDLLSEQPQFADKCDKWGEFNRLQKKSLLKKQPQLARYFNKNN